MHTRVRVIRGHMRPCKPASRNPSLACSVGGWGEKREKGANTVRGAGREIPAHGRAWRFEHMALSPRKSALAERRLPVMAVCGLFVILPAALAHVSSAREGTPKL
jgi:hypothetical protein